MIREKIHRDKLRDITANRAWNFKKRLKKGKDGKLAKAREFGKKD